MKPAEIKRALEIVEDALELSGRERDLFLNEACGDDSSLRREVLSYLDYNVEGTVLPLVTDSSTAPEIPHASVSETRYDLGDEIARGGMGVIFRTFDNNIQRDVAVKVLRSELESKPDVVRRFLQEAQIGGQLQHPGIAPVYEIGRLPDGRPFIAMKLVKGATLEDLLAQRRDANNDQMKFLVVFEQVCQTIAFAHRRGVIHRDLKPSNVMVGEFGEVQVMDWGIAKLLRDRQPEVSDSEGLNDADVPASDPVKVDTDDVGHSTRVGQLMGSPAYMAPEQSVGRAGKTADVFSLGVMLCEILTGEKTAGEADAAGERLDRCGCDRALAELAKDCLQRNEADRPQNAGVVAARIAAHLNAIQSRLKEAEIATARAEVKAEEERKLRRRNLWIIAAVGLLLLLAGIGGPIVAVHQSKLRQEAADEHALAETRAAENRRNLYFAEMNLASRSGESGGIRRLRALTEKWIPKPGEEDLRGWEWHYLNARHRRELLSFDRHEETVRRVAWSRDGRRMASSDLLGIVRVWDPDTAEELRVFDDLSGEIAWDVVWSPDGSRLAAAGGSGHMVVWEADSGKVVWSKRDATGKMRCLSWRPNGKHIAFGCGDGAVRIRIAEDGQMFQTLSGPAGTFVESLDWNADGTRLASGYNSGATKIWESPPGRVLLDPAGDAPISSVAWSPDGRWLAGEDRATRDLLLWDPVSPESPPRRLKGHFSIVDALAWSPDGSRLASSSMDRTVRIWDPAAGEEHLVLPALNFTTGIAWDPEGDRVAFGMGDRISVSEVRREETPVIPVPLSATDSLGWSSSGHRFAAGFDDGSIRVWDLKSEEPRIVYREHQKDAIIGLQWEPGGDRIASAGGDFLIWTPESGEASRRINGHDRVRGLTWSPEGHRIATAENHGTLKIWNAADGTVIKTLPRNKLEGPPFSLVAWSPDGQWLAAAAIGGPVCLWETESWEPVGDPFAGKTFGGLVWSPESNRLAFGSITGEIQVVDRDRGETVFVSLGHEMVVTALAWHPDGSRLASGGFDRTIRIWDAETGTQCLALLAHDEMVNALAWSPDGTRLLSRGRDRTIKLWEAKIETD